jgi:kinetochore protein Mis13/DSN1
MKAAPPALLPALTTSNTTDAAAPPSPSTLDPSLLDPSLLDPEDATILSMLRSSSSADLLSRAQSHLASVQQSLEFSVDRFADGVHKLEQAVGVFDSLSGRVLALSAVRLEEREGREREKVGTRELPIQEVLRTLSRVIPGGSSS